MFIIIDSGSTQSRLYLLRDKQVIAEQIIACGVNSGATANNNAAFKQAIAQGIVDLLADNRLTVGDIRFAIASGMITSNLGLLEVPHITAPVSIEQLAAQVVKVRDHNILPLDLEIRFIPGVKNPVAGGGWQHLRDVDLMRGEETQAVGMIVSSEATLPLTMIELGSTTKLIHIDASGRIAGSITSLSGQVYGAVKKETFIGASMRDDSDEEGEFFSAEILQQACESVEHAGLLRSLLFTRFIQFSLPTTAAERAFFCQAALAADDIKLFREAQRMGFSLEGDIVLIGKRHRCEIYRALLASQLGITRSLRFISEKSDIDDLAIKGASYIANQQG